MAALIEGRQRAIAAAAFGATLALMMLAIVLLQMRSAAAQDEASAPSTRIQVAQVPPTGVPVAAPPVPGAPARGVPGAVPVAPRPQLKPVEPSRPNPFVPVAGERQFTIRSFYGPTYSSLPITMTMGFPQIERPEGLLAGPLTPPVPEPYMRCSAIVWDKGGNVVAVVQMEQAGQLQGFTVHPGDLVGSYVVEEITQSGVTLRDRDTGNRRTVRLESARALEGAGAPAAPPAVGPAPATPAAPAGPRRPMVTPVPPRQPQPRGTVPRGLPAPPPA